MNNNLFNKAKEDSKLALRTVNLVARISKLKLDISAINRRKKVALKAMGTIVMDVYRRERELDAQTVYVEIHSELIALQDMDRDLQGKEAEILQLREDFKASGGKGPPP